MEDAVKKGATHIRWTGVGRVVGGSVKGNAYKCPPREDVELEKVRDRIAFESNCAKEKIIKQSVMVQGDDHLYKMSACGKDYVCNTNGIKAECKLVPPSE